MPKDKKNGTKSSNEGPALLKRLEIREGRWGHEYFLDGKKIPGVTTIINAAINKADALKYWAVNTTLDAVAYYLRQIKGGQIDLTEDWIATILSESKKSFEIVSKKAKNIGTEAHALIAAHLKGQPSVDETASAEAKGVFEQFRKWYKDNPFKILYVEQAAVSEKFGFGCRIDFVGESKEGVFVADWKTSKDGTAYNELAFQLGGNAIAFEETFGVRPAWALGVSFGKEVPVFNPYRVTDLEASKREFLGCLQAYPGIKKRKVLEEMVLTTAGTVAEW